MPAMHNPKLLDNVRNIARLKHFSLRTERSYIDWIRHFILFHNKRHPVHMAEPETRSSRQCGRLLYGSGLRLMEGLRVKDMDFRYNQNIVRDGKGQKHRIAMLPESLKPALDRHLKRV